MGLYIREDESQMSTEGQHDEKVNLGCTAQIYPR